MSENKPLQMQQLETPAAEKTPEPIEVAVISTPIPTETQELLPQIPQSISQPTTPETLPTPEPLVTKMEAMEVAITLTTELSPLDPVIEVMNPELIWEARIEMTEAPQIQMESQTEIQIEMPSQETSVHLAPEQVEQMEQLRHWEINLKLDPPTEILTSPILEKTNQAQEESPLAMPFFPGLTTEVENLPTLNDSEEVLPMAAGMENQPILPPTSIPVDETLTQPQTNLIQDEKKVEESIAAMANRKDPKKETIQAPSGADEAAQPATPVTFVADPYGFNTLDVTAAQNDEWLEIEDDLDEDLGEDAPLELNTSEEELNETLENLQSKLEVQEKELEAEMKEAQALAEEDAKKLLAAQIAEDEALEKASKEEAEQDLANDPDVLRALPREPEEDENGNLDLAEMESCIEALLFMVEKPISANKLRDLLGPEMSLSYFQEALTNLQKRYQRFHHGVELAEVGNGYQFRTKPVRAALAKKLAKIQTQRLSTGAMETLAIVAYKQPVMKDDIDKIRGVDSSHFIRGLLDKKLIKIAGRSDLPGRPMVYETTAEFMEVFGVKNLDSLPPLREIEAMVPGSQSGGEEDPRVKEMRKLVGQMNADDSVSLLYDPKEDEKFLTDIRERVKGIEISTPTLEQQKLREKLIAEGKLDPQSEEFEQALRDAAPNTTAELPLTET